MSILKLGPINSILSSSIVNCPKSTSIKNESTISSTILNSVVFLIVLGRGSNVFINNSCASESLFNKILTAGITISSPKFKANSLKYEELPNSDINVLTALSNILFSIFLDIDFNSVRVDDIVLRKKGYSNSSTLNILFL